MGTTKKRAAPDRYDTRWTETQAHFCRSERRDVSLEVQLWGHRLRLHEEEEYDHGDVQLISNIDG